MMPSNYLSLAVLRLPSCFQDLPMQLVAKLFLSNFGLRQNDRQVQWFLSPLIRSTGVI